MGELLLSVCGDGPIVDLIALAIIVGSLGQQDTASISTAAIRSPNAMNVSQEFVIIRLGSPVDEDVTTVPRLTGLSLWECHMAILLEAKSNVCAGRGFQART